jgi:hypothetical protein
MPVKGYAGAAVEAILEVREARCKAVTANGKA